MEVTRNFFSTLKKKKKKEKENGKNRPTSV